MSVCLFHDFCDKQLVDSFIFGLLPIHLNYDIGWPADRPVERGEGHRQRAHQAQGEKEKTYGKGENCFIAQLGS